ncbi:hypothetical protein [Streptodolium elevatio]
MPQIRLRQFLDTYYDAVVPGWRYAPAGGYVIGHYRQPISWQRQLSPGQDVDRYDSEYGSLLAPDGYLKRVS